MISYLHDCPPADPSSPVLVPGEPEAIARNRAEREGVNYDEAAWATLVSTARELGVELP
jgi:LDH2 family malate/lactate/ureidoglycolate dehydrogenase